MRTISINLAGKVAVIIGGTSGIGRTLSLGFAEAGADVIASARRKQNVEEVASEIEARGRKTIRSTSAIANRSNS
jgi:NAD(P)-dependent dehydrogenase (short-subunit alcohol dehydrogenase family)